MIPSGIFGASLANTSRSTLRVFRSRALTPMTFAPGVDRPVELLLGVHLDQRDEPDRLGPLDQRHQGLLLQAATISRARSAPYARASHSW